MFFVHRSASGEGTDGLVKGCFTLHFSEIDVHVHVVHVVYIRCRRAMPMDVFFPFFVAYFCCSSHLDLCHDLPEAGQEPNTGECRVAQGQVDRGCSKHDRQSGVLVSPAGLMVSDR